MRRNLVPGIFLIAIGVIFLLSNLNIIEDLSQWWPVVLIAIGVGILLSKDRQ